MYKSTNEQIATTGFIFVVQSEIRFFSQKDHLKAPEDAASASKELFSHR